MCFSPIGLKDSVPKILSGKKALPIALQLESNISNSM